MQNIGGLIDFNKCGLHRKTALHFMLLWNDPMHENLEQSQQFMLKTQTCKNSFIITTNECD